MTNIDRYQQFMQECTICIKEMQSLDNATKAGGKIGYDSKTHTFFSTKFSATETYIGTKAAWLSEQAYRKITRSSTENSIHVLKNLNMRIKKAVRDATNLLSENLDAKQRQEVLDNLESLKKQVAHTKEDGVNAISQFYALRASDSTRDTLRKKDFKKIYERFNAEIVDMESSLATWDPHASQKEAVAKEIVGKGAKNKLHLQATSCPKDPHHLLQIPMSVVEDAKKETFKILKNGESGKTELEAAALAIAPFKKAPDITLQSHSASWRSYRVEDKVVEKATYGTSEKRGHLCNIKVQHDPALNLFVITCGVIDTEQKADEFITILVRELEKRGKTPVTPLHLSLHQLNSYGQISIDIMGWNVVKATIIGESALIADQHRMSRYIENRLRRDVLTATFCKKHGLIKPGKDDAIVTHDNTAFNIASELNKGEDEINQLISLEAYATRALWALDHIAEGRKDKKIDHFRQKLAKIRNKIFASKENKLLEKSLRKLQDSARSTLQELVTFLRKRAETENSMRISFIADVLMQAFASENRIRIREVERNFLLDLMLGSLVEINCKSGLDRTGMARALWDSLMTIRSEIKGKDALDQLIDLVNKQDALSAENNKLMLAFMKENNIKAIEDLDKPEAAYKGNFRKDYLAYLKTHIKNAKHLDELKRALHYQDLVAYHLLTVALPITQESTGVVGLKYNHKNKFAANPHPLNRIPMIMQTEEGVLIRNFHPTTGQGWTDWMGHTMTPACSALFERLSPARGA